MQKCPFIPVSFKFFYSMPIKHDILNVLIKLERESMTPRKKYYEAAAETLIKNLDKRGMEAYYVDNAEDALNMALRFVTPGSSVSWGGSMTITDLPWRRQVS